MKRTLVRRIYLKVRNERVICVKFDGIGNLIYKNEYNLESKISFIWDENNLAKKYKLEVHAISNDSSLIYKLHEIPFFPWGMTGRTTSGKEFSGEGLALVSKGEKINTGIDEVALCFTCNVVNIGIKEGDFDYIEFFFPNIFIVFDKFQKLGQIKTRNISNLELEYKGINYNITLSGLNDVITKKNEIILCGNDTFTLKIKITRKNENICFNEAKEVIEIISELMSIVYGDSVRWVNAIGYDKSTVKYNSLRDIKYSNLHPFRQLIELDFPFNLTSFLKNSFNIYAGFSKEKGETIRRLYSGLHFSSERLVFPEPFTSLGSCIEDFVADIIPETESHYITRADRRRIDSSFATWVTENIIPKLNDVDKADFDESGMKQKLSALIQRNMRSRISKLLEYYKLDYEQAWVSNFVKKRNNAAHGNYIYEDDDYLNWSRMASLLERVLLKELDFKGTYIDWSQSPPVTKEFN